MDQLPDLRGILVTGVSEEPIEERGAVVYTHHYLHLIDRRGRADRVYVTQDVYALFKRLLEA